MELILENVRSFCDRHSIPLRPLTVLVGENSTGKTSLLAMLAHVQDPGFPSTRPAFNIPPFEIPSRPTNAASMGVPILFQ